MSFDEEQQQEEAEHEDGAMPDLDDAFEEDIDDGEDEDLGPLSTEEDEDDLDADFLGDDKDGNY